MFAVYRIFYRSDITVGTHDGYCSGAECEDEDREFNEYLDVAIDKKNVDFFNFILQHLYLQKISKILYLYDYLKQNYNELSFDNLCHGRGYCDRSESGLKHDYRINSQKITSIEFYEYIENYQCNLFLLDDLRIEFYNILFCLKENKIVKDMRVLFMKEYCKNAMN
jgi:hypothetical protein